MFKPLIYDKQEYKGFEIDECGNIKNLKTNHIYKSSVDYKGYLVVYLPLGKRGKVKCVKVHKAVAETFIPNPNNYPIVNHIDENKQNSHISNLEWTTQKGNVQAHLKKCNETNCYFNNRKFTYDEVKIIRALKNHISQRKLAYLFDVSRVTIINIQNGKHYTNGY